MKNLLVLLFFSYATISSSYGQLSVQASNPTTNKLETIVQSLVGTGVRISNITSNKPSGSPFYGTFQEPSGQLGIRQGLLMTTETVQIALGPNNSGGETHGDEDPGDPSLDALLDGYPSIDACVIEFDLITTSTEISFNYIFGSEEYPEYVPEGFNYNDVFAFFITGPDIVGEKNIALLPISGIPVTIKNVNDQRNTQYYHDNTGGSITQFDGYTKRLRAFAQVTPCVTYHLKLAIADVVDASYDSGVFIESGSLTGTESLLINSLIAPDSMHICANQLPVNLQAGVNNNVPNYSWKRNGVEVFTGSKFYSATADGWYSVKASRDAVCYWEDSIRIMADPEFTLAITDDTVICAGNATTLEVIPTGSSGYTYLWSPSTALSNTNTANPVTTTTGPITYSVMVTAGLCSHQESVSVSIAPPIHLQATANVQGCVGIPVQLQASGAEEYLWSPSGNLNDATLPNPLATLSSDAGFKVVGSNHCYKDSLTVNVAIYAFPTTQAYGDTSICYGAATPLSADPGPYQYSWSPATSLTDPSSPNPQASPLATTQYVLTVSNHGCIKKDSVVVSVTPELKAQIVSLDPYIQIPKMVNFGNASIGGSDYTWYFTGKDSSKAVEPSFEFNTEDYYTVVLKVRNNFGCIDYDTLSLTAYKFFIPNLITPNEDGKNDRFEITGIGDQFVLEIYNRWGDQVYKKSNYRNEWDGEGLNDGIYYYRINDSLKDKDYKGWVQIIR